MSDNRYPLICLKRLIEIDSKETPICKYNWVTQVKEFFLKQIGEENLFNFTGEELKEKQTTLVETYNTWLIEQDLKSLSSSSSLLILHYLNLTQGPQLYLQGRLPLKFSRLIMQVRLINDICPRIIYNSEIYKLTKDEHCHYCNELNNLVHIIFSCSYLHAQRLPFLKCIGYQNYTTDASIILIY